MKELNGVTMGTAQGAPAKLPRPVDFPAGRGCARVRCEAQVQIKNTDAAPQDYTGARAKKALSCLFDTATMRFGDRRQDIVDANLSYARARELALGMTGDDFVVVNPTTGVPTRVKDIADADVLKAAVAAGATFTLTVEYFRPFELIRLGEDAYAYCPGTSQMKQIQWEFARGASFDTDGKFIQNAPADLLFIADDFEAHDDKWAAVPRLYQQEEAGRVSHGPKGRIGLLSMWEYTSVGSATALTIFTLNRTGDTPLHDTVRASRVVRDALYNDPPGVYDLNALATVLHSLPGAAEKQDIPVGEGFQLEQTGTELNPAKTAWLYVPVRDEDDLDAYVGANVEDEAGVKLVNAAAKSPRSLPSTAAALEPVIVVRRGSADFEALPGRVYARGVAATTHLPGAVVAAARAAVAAAGDKEAQDAAASKVSTQIAKAAPGWLSGRRGVKSTRLAALRSRFFVG